MKLVSITAVAVVLLACVAIEVNAALKSLTHKEKLRFAKHVFVGTVVSVESKDISKAPKFPDWITTHYKLTVRVDNLGRTTKHTHENPSHPADETLADVGSNVHVMMWKATSRPDYFTGDMGAQEIPEVGKAYTFFAHYLHADPNLRHMYHESFPHVDEEGMKAYNTMMPNGIGPASEIEEVRADL